MLRLGPIAIGDTGAFALASPPARGAIARFASAGEALTFLRRELTHAQLRQIRRMLAHDGAFGHDDDDTILRRLADEIARHRVIVLRRIADRQGRSGASAHAAPPVVPSAPVEPLAPEPLATSDDIAVRATIEVEGGPWIVHAELTIDDEDRRAALAAEETSE